MSGTDTREGASTRDGGLQTASCPPTPPARCLVHIVRSTSLKYSKVRQFQEHFQFDVCRHEVRYGCLREDSCHFAHSFIELKVWLLQQYSGEGSGGGSGEDSGGGSGEGEDYRVQRRTVMLWWGAAEKPVLPGHPRTQRLCIRGLPAPEDPGFIPAWALPGEPVRRSQEAELHGPPGWSGHQRPLTKPPCSSVRQ